MKSKQYLTVKSAVAVIFIIASIVSVSKMNDDFPEMANATGSIAAAIIAAAALIGFVMIDINEKKQ